VLSRAPCTELPFNKSDIKVKTSKIGNGGKSEEKN
jgi:hypothetical protein